MSSTITTTTTTSTTKSLLRLKHWLCGWRKQWDEGGTWFRSGVVNLCWNVSGNPRWQIGPQIRYLAAVAFKIRKPINLMAESAEVSVHEVDYTDSISLHNKLSIFLFIEINVLPISKQAYLTRIRIQDHLRRRILILGIFGMCKPFFSFPKRSTLSLW